MFNLIMLALPGFIKGKLPTMLKCAKWVGVAIILLTLLFGMGMAVNKMLQSYGIKAKEASENKVLVAVQDKQIQQQKQELEQIKQTLEQMKASHEKTLAVVQELKQEQKKIEIVVTKKKQVIDKTLKEIDTLDIPEADKDQQKSAVLIKGLNETYCELFKDSCKAGVN